jgi:hypothetical protein
MPLTMLTFVEERLIMTGTILAEMESSIRDGSNLCVAFSR